MNDNELLPLLALQKIEGVGDIMTKKLLQAFGSASEVFKAKPAQLASISGVGKVLLQNFKDSSVFDKAQKELKFIRDNNITVRFFTDSNYPERLKHCIDGPVLLFTTGNIDLDNNKIISIVGTRKITSYGIDFCKNIIAELAPLNPIIVSGYAYGVDIVAHQAAIENNLQTIAVLAHGLNQIYPAVHKKYSHDLQKNGGFMTEFCSTANPNKENFVKRNRIVAGIAQATIVIESANSGGSLITANMANDYNREVFAVPGRTNDKYSQGCNNLIKTQKAQLLTCAADIVYHLNWDLPIQTKTIQKQLFISLDSTEQKVFDFLQQNAKQSIDTIALQCSIPVFKLSSLLLNLELKGIIRPLPGKMFEIV